MRFIIALILLFICSVCDAQIKDTVLSVENYNSYIRQKAQNLNFLEADKAVIQHHEELKSFFRKLSLLKTQNKGTVNIVHLGDSHIQAGYFSGIVRRGLQQYFGNAGRGLVFPYRLAKSNGPHDYVSFSSNQWKGYRNVNNPDTIATGLMGFVVTSNDTSVSVGISLRNNEGVNYTFNNVELYSGDLGSAKVSVTDSVGLISAKCDSFDSDKYVFPSQVTNLEMNVQNNSGAFKLYGMNLLNDSSGIVYHTIGVNGAECSHFLHQPLLPTQLKSLNTDLYILSFGTNEAFSKSFDLNVFIQTIDSTIQMLKKVSPNAEFLITSPAESCVRIRRGRYASNPKVLLIRNALKNYCDSKAIAFFDLYECVGGKGSMLKFARAHMTDVRRIHFTRLGYEIQGLMLLDALMKNTEQ